MHNKSTYRGAIVPKLIKAGKIVEIRVLRLRNGGEIKLRLGIRNLRSNVGREEEFVHIEENQRGYFVSMYILIRSVSSKRQNPEY